MKPSVLSTKKLTPAQRELLLNVGIGLVERDFISIIPLDIPEDLTPESLPKNLIFTSKNSVERLNDLFLNHDLEQYRVFCVGEKTEALLLEKGFLVVESAHYGAELARIIVNDYKKEEFHFFCGKMRNPDLPLYLQEHHINFRETYIYNTVLTPTKIDRIFEGVLFFSPSGVKSYCSENSLSESTAFCIGTTTAAEAEKHSQKIIVAKKPTIESVIVQVARHFSEAGSANKTSRGMLGTN